MNNMPHTQEENRPKVRSVSLSNILKNVYEIDPSAHRHMHKGCLVGHHERSHISFFEDPIRIDAIAFVICTKGSLECSCNFKDYKIEEGSLLLLQPQSLIDARTDSIEHEGYTIILDQEYLKECNFSVGRFTSLMLQLSDQPHVKLTPEELSRLINAIKLLDALIGEQIDSPFREDVIRAMVETTMYLICENFSTHLKNESNNRISRQESYFRQFMQELSLHYTERKGVTFYAEKLCISPRYLTTIVRRISGMTVTDWMDRYLIKEAKYLLKYSEMSIQEIAYQLSFSDQSFFGKYFRLHVGMSPTAYRNQQQ